MNDRCMKPRRGIQLPVRPTLPPELALIVNAAFHGAMLVAGHHDEAQYSAGPAVGIMAGLVDPRR